MENYARKSCAIVKKNRRFCRTSKNSTAGFFFLLLLYDRVFCNSCIKQIRNE